MVRKLLVFKSVFLFSILLQAQIPTVGNEDDFQNMADGTMNWTENGISPNPPVRVADGGPLGAGDAYMENAATGTGAAGSRVIVYNQTQWTGDFSGFAGIQFDVRANTNDLEFRVAMHGAGGSICSTNSVVVTTADGWTTVTIPISEAEMQTVNSNLGSGTDVGLTLGDVFQVRIISSDLPSFAGDKVNAIMDLDNIVALPTLSIPEFDKNWDFQITPNPGNSLVNLTVPSHGDDMKLEVFDVLGKRIHRQMINAIDTNLNVSSWKNGVYLVRMSSDSESQTKRFIKQ